MKTPESLLRETSPTDGLEAAVAAFRYPAAAHRRWPAAAGLATALAVGAAALRLSAPSAEASPLARIAQAERSAQRCTARFFGADGKPGDLAWQEGRKARFDSAPDAPYGHTNAFDGERTWFLLRDAGVALIARGRQAQVTPPLLQKVGDFRGERIRTERRADGTTHVVVERRLATDQADWERHTIVADRQSRPVSIEYAVQKAGKWRVMGREVRDYDAPIPPDAFRFRVPKGYEAYDVDANRERLRQGFETGSTKSVGGLTVRLLGALQERSGRVTAVYTGGTTPLPDATAYAERDGERYAGTTLVGNAPDVSPARAIRPGKPPVRSSARMTVDTLSDPYVTLEGRPIRIVQFDLPKLSGNPARPLDITLPAVVEGKSRSVLGEAWNVRGRGVPVGSATFRAVVPIRSNGAEEIARLPSVRRGRYQIGLKKPDRPAEGEKTNAL